MRIFLLAFAILVGGLIKADALEIKLACHSTEQRNLVDVRFINIDRIIIDVEKQKIDMVSSSNNDDWTYTNKPYNDGLDWVEKIVIHQFKDGIIMASGLRFSAAYNMIYEPKLGKLDFASKTHKEDWSVSFKCRKI